MMVVHLLKAHTATYTNKAGLITCLVSFKLLNSNYTPCRACSFKVKDNEQKNIYFDYL